MAVTAAASLALGCVPAEAAESLGACAWGKVPAHERSTFLAAYQAGMQAGMAQLSSADSQLQRYVSECAHRNDLPRLWVQGAVGSAAIQDGAATALSSSLRISRRSLDEAWTQAPPAARECTRANAAKAFGLNETSCSDSNAPIWFLHQLGISPATDRADAAQALYFMNDKAQGEWADALIGRFVEQPASS